MAKKNLFTTPKGVAQYPWLNIADTQYDAAGKYKSNLRANFFHNMNSYRLADEFSILKLL
jgi:hypothetical protein